MYKKIKDASLTQNEVKELFSYSDGHLIRKTNISQCKIGDVAGHLNKGTGYVMIQFNGTLCYAHRLIFLLHHGYIPKQIDHADGNRINNKIENLRESTQSQNMQNKAKTTRPTTSKYKGVCFDKSCGKWLAHIKVDGHFKNLGYHRSEVSAALAYNKAALFYYKDFSRINNI